MVSAQSDSERSAPSADQRGAREQRCLYFCLCAVQEEVARPRMARRQTYGSEQHGFQIMWSQAETDGVVLSLLLNPPEAPPLQTSIFICQRQREPSSMLSHKQESLSGPPHTPELLAQSYLHGSLQRHRRHNVILQLSSPRAVSLQPPAAGDPEHITTRRLLMRESHSGAVRDKSDAKTYDRLHISPQKPFKEENQSQRGAYSTHDAPAP